MQLPSAVESMLQGGRVAYTTTDTTAAAGHAAGVRSIVLQDAHGRLQVLIGADSLLDLAALGRFAGRELAATPEDELGHLCAARGLLSLPSLPGVLDLPILVDRCLLDRSELLLDSGGDGVMIRLGGAELRQLVEQHGGGAADFSVRLAELEARSHDAVADAADITGAVAKFTTRRIQKRLEDTLDFPPLPEIAHRIIRIGADPHASVKELAQAVEIDPSLSAQVVSWASSPYYAAPGKIRSIQDAIVRVLGFDLVMNLALGLALGKTLRLPREGRYGYRSYWLQAVHGAAMVEGLGKAMPSTLRPPAGLSYLTGLLHNFGFLLLAELFKPQLQLVCHYAEANPHAGHWAVERFLLGVTREQIAAWLLRAWHLPEEVSQAIRHQHQPQRAGEHETLATLLHVAGLLLRQQGIGSAPFQRVPDELFARLGIGRSEALAVAEHIRHSTADLGALARDLAA